MNINKNKKAVSAVIATVLIILITIAAVTIIWAAIIPMIQNQLSGSTDCLDPSAHMSLNEDTTCYKNVFFCNVSHKPVVGCTISTVCSTSTCSCTSTGVSTGACGWSCFCTCSASCSDATGYSFTSGKDLTGTTNVSYNAQGAEVSLGVKRAQGIFDAPGIIAKVFVGGKTYSEKISQTIGTNSESTIRVANVSYIGVTKVSYAPLIKKVGGTAEEECPNVREVFVKPCA